MRQLSDRSDKSDESDMSDMDDARSCRVARKGDRLTPPKFSVGKINK